MALLKLYRSTDQYAPTLNGTSGSLLAVLDAVLVNGYGTQTGAGWSKPIANDTHIGCYRAPSGSRMILHVNDAGIYNSVGTKDAQFTGYDTLYGLTGSAWGNGSGSGQFPFPNFNANTSGSVWVRKSVTSDSASRNWMIFADDRTVIGFFQTMDGTIQAHSMFYFGDIYSFSQYPDKGNCLLAAKILPGYAAAVTTDPTDYIFLFYTSNYCFSMAKSAGGNANSVKVHLMGDSGKATWNNNGYAVNIGVIPYPSFDGNIHIAPISVGEHDTFHLRGRARGLYHVCHPFTTISNGQVFQGANEYAGKTFMVIKPSPSSGMWVVEISNTVETNYY